MPGPHRFARTGLRATDVLVNGLTALGRRVITLDPPGSGLWRRPARLGMQEMLDCADEALEISGVNEHLDAVGHSMSGLALLAYAIERPRRIGRLVLIGTGSGGPAYMTAPGALWNQTLILCGRQDPQFPPARSEELARNIKHATLIFFERSGHFPFIEEPETFWSAIAKFLSKATGVPPAIVPVARREKALMGTETLTTSSSVSVVARACRTKDSARMPRPADGGYTWKSPQVIAPH